MEKLELTEAQLEQMLADKRKAKKAQKQKKINDYEQKKIHYIDHVTTSFKEMADRLLDLKSQAIKQAKELHKEMYQVYEKPEKTTNQYTLENTDSSLKVVVEMQERQSFNEKAEVHINTIKDILRSKFQNRNKAMYEIIDAILMKNRKGDYDEKLVAKLNKHRDAVNDESFNEALDYLAGCYQTYDSVTYIRCYEKDSSNKWQNINIQFSSL